MIQVPLRRVAGQSTRMHLHVCCKGRQHMDGSDELRSAHSDVSRSRAGQMADHAGEWGGTGFDARLSRGEKRKVSESASEDEEEQGQDDDPSALAHAPRQHARGKAALCAHASVDRGAKHASWRIRRRLLDSPNRRSGEEFEG